jgi:uroporphyrin-III C-methyltransferase / precorrin-2 dehydrogenase / sirohydrochlorin ferrochelatase
MIGSLPLFHNIAGQPVIVLGEGEAAQAKRRLVERAGGVVVSDVNSNARIAFIAVEEPESIRDKLKARGVLVNVPDHPELCDFTVPSILDRSPVLIAVGTGGASAGLAKALRLRLEQLLPQKLGQLAAEIAAARDQVRIRWPSASDRRKALDAALCEGGMLDPLIERSATCVGDWLQMDASPAKSSLAEICLTSDDPDNLTLRQARLLGTADVVAHDPDVPASILNRARADAIRVVLADKNCPIEIVGAVVVIRRSA